MQVCGLILWRVHDIISKMLICMFISLLIFEIRQQCYKNLKQWKRGFSCISLNSLNCNVNCPKCGTRVDINCRLLAKLCIGQDILYELTSDYFFDSPYMHACHVPLIYFKSGHRPCTVAIIFTCAMLYGRVSVHRSVCLPQVGVLLKRLNAVALDIYRTVPIKNIIFLSMAWLTQRCDI